MSKLSMASYTTYLSYLCYPIHGVDSNVTRLPASLLMKASYFIFLTIVNCNLVSKKNIIIIIIIIAQLLCHGEPLHYSQSAQNTLHGDTLLSCSAMVNLYIILNPHKILCMETHP